MSVVQIGGWSIKASSLDDQILIIMKNDSIMETHVKLFYCEEKANQFVESLLNNDTSDKVN